MVNRESPDESIVILSGFSNAGDAAKAFNDKFGHHPSELTPMTIEQFKAWLAGDTSRPLALAESAPIQEVAPDIHESAADTEGAADAPGLPLTETAAPAQRAMLMQRAMELVWGSGKVYP